MKDIIMDIIKYDLDLEFANPDENYVYFKNELIFNESKINEIIKKVSNNGELIFIEQLDDSINMEDVTTFKKDIFNIILNEIIKIISYYTNIDYAKILIIIITDLNTQIEFVEYSMENKIISIKDKIYEKYMYDERRI